MRDTVYIYGHSDDLIEVEGDVNAEFSVPLDVEDGGVRIEFANGDTFRLTYDGEWTVGKEHPLHSPYSAVHFYEPGEVDHGNDYSQVAIYEPWNGTSGVEVVDDE